MEQSSSLDFGDLLKAFRKSRHLTQGQLAERTGNSRQTVGNWERGMKLPKSRTALLEVAKVLRLSEQETRQLIEASFVSPVPHWLVPHPRNQLFTGREDSLAILHRLLSAEKTVVLTQSLAIHGLGGVGKTQLALEYAYRHKLAYRAIFWIHAETLEQIISSFVAIAAYLELPEHKQTDQQHIIAAVQRWLNKQRGWLLIWDNLEDFEVFSQFISAAPFGAHLITTRSPVHGTLARGFELLTLPPEYALLFVLRRTKLLDPFATPRELALWARRNTEEYQAARELIDLLECLPLALDQAGAYIEETRCGLTGYLVRYRKHRGQLLTRRGSPDAGHPESVATTFALASQRLANAHPQANDLLKVMAFLGAENIPEELFMNPLPELGSALKDVLGNPVEFDLALAALLHSSLIQRQPEKRCFSLHRLVQTVQQEELGEEGQCRWAEAAVRLVAATFPDSKDFANWELCQRLLPHALICANHVERWGFTFLEGARLLNEVGVYLRQRAQFAEALPLLERGLAIREQVLGPLHLEVAASINDLGGYYWTVGIQQKALSLFKRALSIREGILGSGAHLVAQSLNNMGMVHERLGQYQEAALMLQRALSIFEQTLGLDHPYIATCQANLAYLLLRLGQLGECLKLHLQALAIRQKAFGPEHPDVANSSGSIANIYLSQGKLQEAEELHRQALAVRERTLGSDHPDVAGSLQFLADTLYAQGNLEEAKTLYQRALAIYEPKVGNVTHEVALVLASLAEVCWYQGNFAEAHNLFQQALTRQERTEGSEHPETVKTRARYAQLVRELNQGPGANPPKETRPSRTNRRTNEHSRFP